MENNTVYEEEFAESAAEINTEENGEGLQEIRQDAEEILGQEEYEDEIEAVSDGDSATYDEEYAMIIEEIIAQRQQLDTMQEYVEYCNQNIYEKPLADYTVTESLLLLTMFFVLFGLLLKIIGGIITCKI